MVASLPTTLPYGIRDCKLTPYVDAGGSILGDTSVDLPNMQTFSFSEKEEFQDLRGDDRIITTRGKGAQVEWSIEAGGVNMKVWAILTGGQIIETGTTPDRKIVLRKKGTDSRPFFRVDGQAISDSGGDVRCIVYRCRCNDSIQGDFKDGEFFITSVSGLGLPLLDDTNDILYDFVQNETRSTITLTPDPNPIPAPQNIEVGTVLSTSVVLDWDDVVDADSYIVEKSVSPYSSWTSATGSPFTPSTGTVTGLVTATAYKFRVRAVVDGVEGPNSNPTGVVTTA